MDDASWRAMSQIAHDTAALYTWDDATARFENALQAIVSKSAGRSSTSGATSIR
jgi:hypothetical protein